MMNELSDQELLHDYASHHSEPAFGELVRRHTNLVYSAALRMVGETHSAEDVTQSVFMALSQNAGRLTKHPVLSGWLHCTTRNLAAKSIRADLRRHAREQQATVMKQILSSEPEASWEQIAPHLDAALGQLSEPDREVVLFRYFEKKSASELGRALGISDEAAQKRVSRAVERLRELFSKRGITVGASGLVVLISANAVESAPVGLAVTISAMTSAGAGIAASSVITATKTIAMTTFQKVFVAASIAVLAGGVYEAHQASQLRNQIHSLKQREGPLSDQISLLTRQRDDASNQLVSMRDANQQFTNDTAELLRLRGMAGVARRAVAEVEQLRAQQAKLASEVSNNPVAGAMADAMKQAMLQQVEGRLSRITTSLRLTPEQVQATREILTRQAQVMSAGMQQAFSGKYDKEEIANLAKRAGNTDEQIKALLTPEQLATFPAYQQEEAAHNASLVANNELVQMQASLDLSPQQLDSVYSALYEVSLSQLTDAKDRKFADVSEQVQWVLEQKVKVLSPLLTETQLEAYRQQQAFQAKLVRDIASKMGTPGGAK